VKASQKGGSGQNAKLFIDKQQTQSPYSNNTYHALQRGMHEVQSAMTTFHKAG
jgi:hypothetical protein